MEAAISSRLRFNIVTVRISAIAYRRQRAKLAAVTE